MESIYICLMNSNLRRADLTGMNLRGAGLARRAAARGDLIMIMEQVSFGCSPTIKGHSHHVNSVAFSPDGKLVVSGSGDKTVRLWEVATGKKMQELEGDSDDVHFKARPNYLGSFLWI